MRRVTYLMVLALAGCQDLTETAAFAPLDRPFFDCRVQPVLTKTCAGFACHGDAARYFTTFTRNRLRYGGTEDERNAQMRTIERDFNYTSALAEVDADDPEQSLLLLKPLAEGGGGYFHRGAEIFGKGDVFADREDRDFLVLSDWVNGATEDPSCVEPGSE